MATSHPIAIALAVALALVTLVWVASVVKRDASIIDVFWGFGFVVLGWVYFVAAAGRSPRGYLVVGLVTLWGLRLSLHILWRNWGKGEDYRYREMRERSPASFPLRSLLSVFWLQALLLWVISMPLYQAQRGPDPASLTPLDLLGLALFVVGLVLRGRWGLAAVALQARPGEPGQGHEPGPLALHPTPQLLRGRGRVVGLLLLRGGDTGWLVDRRQPRPDDAVADARLRRDAARATPAADEAGLPGVRRADERLLPLVPRGRLRGGAWKVSGRLCLVTGASGYVGGRLLRELEARSERVRCLARRPEYLRPRIGEGSEVVRGDALDPESLPAAMAGVDVAYYLIHSMGSSGDFESQDRSAARNFARAAREAGVRRIVYLGGLGREPGLSRHLRSRQEVGRILRESGVPTLELRASIVIGSGSLSFEMVRALVQKLPVMITPRWVSQPAQPMAIEDVIEYLVSAADVDLRESAVVEIGGADQVSYLDIMQEFARQRGLKRFMIRVPVLSPRLSGLWLGLVTPVYARVGRELIDSVRNATTVDDTSARRLFPSVQPRGIREAIARALLNEDREFAVTRWSDALSSGAAPPQWGGAVFGSRIVDSRSVRVRASSPEAFAPVRRIGGETGWYYGDWLWRLRGFLDLLVGGVGVRRGRRDPEQLAAGDAARLLASRGRRGRRACSGCAAEMKLPGRAWLQFEVEPDGAGSILRQTAIFDPRGLLGLAYWYALYPLHQLVFAGMLTGIVAAIERGSARRLAAQ